MTHPRLRVAHLTTVDLSLWALLRTELEVDIEAGHDVIGISSGGSYVPEIEALGVTHVAVPAFTRAWSPARDLRAGRQLWRALRGLNLDVLHTHTPKAGVLGRILGRVARIPVIVHTSHGLWAQPGHGLPRRALVHAAEGLAARFSDAELYQNDADREALAWAVPDEKSRTVGNGVDLDRFRPDEEAGRAVRRELGVRDDELLIGGVGRLVAEKGIGEFAHAAKELADRATFVWIGPTDQEKPDAVGGVDGVRLLGMRADMPAIYSALDIFVLPSYREGFSRSSMEAAACRTAMVLSDIPGCQCIGRHEEHALLVRPRDGVAVAQAIARLIDDRALRDRLADAAHARAQGEFDQRVVAKRSLETYEQVALRKGIVVASNGQPEG